MGSETRWDKLTGCTSIRVLKQVGCGAATKEDFLTFSEETVVQFFLEIL